MVNQFASYLTIFLLGIAVIVTVFRIIDLWFHPRWPSWLASISKPLTPGILTAYYLIAILVCTRIILLKLDVIS